MGPRAEQGVLEPSTIATEKSPLLGVDSVVVLVPLLESTGPPSSLSRKELDEFVTDTFWFRLRWAFFVGYWVVLGLLIVASLLFTSRCSGKLPTTAVPFSTTDVLSFQSSTENSFSLFPSSNLT